MPPSIATFDPRTVSIMDAEDEHNNAKPSRGMFERRKRRTPKPKEAIKGVPKGVDPYESDPGESYRDHVQKHKKIACLTVPNLFKTADHDAVTVPAHDSPPTSLPRSETRVRYSLRSTITDGTDPQPMGASVFERRKLRPNEVKLNISHWSDEGGRPYMEDRYVVEDLDAVQVEVAPVPESSNGIEVTYKGKRRVTMPLTFCGVFDGHGGDHASQFCSDWMSSYLRNDESYPYDLGLSMKNAFTNADDDFVATGQPDGTTSCCVTMVGGRRIVCANAGDSRAIVVRKDGSIVRLSRDHKPGMPDETRRISELGGRVIYWGRWRVEGLLAVSRSIGDASLKPFITAEPEICEYDVGNDDLFLIISSDGVWDVMDNDEVAHVVLSSSCAMDQGRLVIDTNRFKSAAKNLCQHAKSCGSADNFSVIVVDLKSCGNPSATSGRYDPFP